MSASEKTDGADYAPSPGLLGLIAAEMQRQRVKWGEQNHPDMGPVWAADRPRIIEKAEAAEQAAKLACEVAVKTGNLSWGLILVEEVAEVVTAAARGDMEALVKELVQVAAVCLSWIEAIGRRGGR